MTKAITNTWLQAKADVLIKYAERLPHKLDRITLKFDQPNAGWIGMHIVKNEEEVGVIGFSDVFDTLHDFIEWIEMQTTNDLIATSINMECENVYHMIDFLPIWFYDGEPDNSWGRRPESCEILTWYDGMHGKMMLDAYCNRYLLVKQLYEGIMEFVKDVRNNPSFAEEWKCDQYTPDDKDYDNNVLTEFFIKSITSDKIETFLQKSRLKI